jgi:hypothetical protein
MEPSPNPTSRNLTATSYRGRLAPSSFGEAEAAALRSAVLVFANGIATGTAMNVYLSLKNFTTPNVTGLP